MTARLETWVERCAARVPAPIEHLYVHAPFCQSLCPYCDFNSHAGRDGEIDLYATAIRREIEAWAPHLRPRTIFVGGGTPTHGRAEQVASFLQAIVEPLDLAALEEFTVEANPGTLDLAKVRALVDVGVTRASLGAQSFHPHLLSTLGRGHSPSDIVRGVEILRRGGIRRLSVDLILAIPGQSEGEQALDVSRAVALAPDHVSAYVLTYEPNTPFHRSWQEGRLPGPDSDREHRHLALSAAILEEAGLVRYEISNFARPGEACRHNLAYWRNADWVGVGAGAHGHVAGYRWRHEEDPAAYAAHLRQGNAPVDFEEEVGAESRALEHLLMGLRLADGIDLEWVRARTGIDVVARCAAILAEPRWAPYFVRDAKRLRVSPSGRDVLDTLLRALEGGLAPAARD